MPFQSTSFVWGDKTNESIYFETMCSLSMSIVYILWSLSFQMSNISLTLHCLGLPVNKNKITHNVLNEFTGVVPRHNPESRRKILNVLASAQYLQFGGTHNELS